MVEEELYLRSKNTLEVKVEEVVMEEMLEWRLTKLCLCSPQRRASVHPEALHISLFAMLFSPGVCRA